MFTWKIERLDCLDKNKAVYMIHYNIKHNESNKTVGTGSIGLNTENTGSDFIHYNNLTEDIILNWVYDALGGSEKVAEYEQQLLSSILPIKGLNQSSQLPW